ncbi:unnamed protein product, partial [Gulo gulo]
MKPQARSLGRRTTLAAGEAGSRLRAVQASSGAWQSSASPSLWVPSPLHPNDPLGSGVPLELLFNPH